MNANVVAIDGPSYVGKSEIAKALAGLIGFTSLNTGHMYRAIAKWVLDHQIPLENPDDLVTAAKGLQFSFKATPEGSRTVVNQEDWTDELNRLEIVQLASKVAQIPKIREILNAYQRRYALNASVVVEGRDIGSVIFPDAKWKFFITASVEARARRLYKMMGEEERKIYPTEDSRILRIRALDDARRKRTVAPLKMAEDAILYDNSDSPSAAQDALILQYYIRHSKEIRRNAVLLESKESSHKVFHGKHCPAS